MLRPRLTDRGIRSLTTDRVQLEVYDGAFPGFGIRVTQYGRKTFFVRYRVDGRHRRLKLGRYPFTTLAQARSRALMALADVERGKDPAAKRQEDRDQLTFRQLAELYIERYAKPRKRTWRDDDRKLRKDVLPFWGSRRASAIERADVIAVLDRIADRGAPVAANRTLTVLRKLFNFGFERGVVSANPCKGIAPPAQEVARDRALSGEEICQLWHALDEEHPSVTMAFRLLIVTGQRSGEVLKMQRGHLEGGLWTIPAEHRKNRQTHIVPLSGLALELLDQWLPQLDVDPKGPVIPAPRGGGIMRSSVLSHVSKRLREQLGFDWRTHDLRHTVATHLGRLGTRRFVVTRILGHSDHSVTGIYDQYDYLAEKREALEAWASYLRDLLRQRRGL